MKKAIIFGIGFVGRAIYRKEKDEYDIIGFIDNNKDISGTKYNGINIYHVNEIKNLDFDVVLFGGIWCDEMQEQLMSLGVDGKKILQIPNSDYSYSTDMREKATDEAMKKLDVFLQSKNIKYTIGGSGLINILRKKPFSCARDVDIEISKYDDFIILKENLSEVFSGYNINIKYFEEDSIVRKKGDLRQIVISDNSDEKICLDIHAPFTYGKYHLSTYMDDFFYFPKNLKDEIIRYSYKDFHVSIPKYYDKILTIAYGKDYIIPPKKWTRGNYKNIVTRKELERMVSKN